MLRLRARLARFVATLAGVALVGGGIAVTVIVPAAADHGPCPDVREDGSIDYSYCDHGPGGGDEGGGDGNEGGGGEEPTCEYYNEFNEFCEGEAACWGNNPAANNPEDLDPEDDPGPPPSEDAHLAYKSCRNPDGTYYDDWYWSEEEDVLPPFPVLAEMAHGRLVPPTISVEFDPEITTYVGADTFFWVEGPTDAEFPGTSALGMVAWATPSHIEIDPGDGSGTIDCGWALAQTENCMRTYNDSSVTGTTTASNGDPAFGATATVVWDVRYEFNGVPMDLDLDPELYTLQASGTTAVPVGEVQVIID